MIAEWNREKILNKLYVMSPSLFLFEAILCENIRHCSWFRVGCRRLSAL